MNLTPSMGIPAFLIRIVGHFDAISLPFDTIYGAKFKEKFKRMYIKIHKIRI